MPRWLIICICVFLFSSRNFALKLASFNIQVFGAKKVQKPAVLETLTKIIRRYHIVYIQEIRSRTPAPFAKLLDSVNNCSTLACGETVGRYIGETSPPYGRTNSKEQYGVIYMPDMVKILKNISIPLDGKAFERPPVCHLLKLLETKHGSNLKEFAVLVAHIDPDSVLSELGSLYEAASVCLKMTQTPNIIILGDMNAGCSYLSKRARNKLKLRTDPSYRWLISDETDTTVGNSACPYDRFIVRGDELFNEILPNSSQPFKFDKEYKLETKNASLVSDHYPIELEIGQSRTNGDSKGQA